MFVEVRAFGNTGGMESPLVGESGGPDVRGVWIGCKRELFIKFLREGGEFMEMLSRRSCGEGCFEVDIGE